MVETVGLLSWGAELAGWVKISRDSNHLQNASSCQLQLPQRENDIEPEKRGESRVLA